MIVMPKYLKEETCLRVIERQSGKGKSKGCGLMCDDHAFGFSWREIGVRARKKYGLCQTELL